MTAASAIDSPLEQHICKSHPGTPHTCKRFHVNTPSGKSGSVTRSKHQQSRQMSNASNKWDLNSSWQEDFALGFLELYIYLDLDVFSRMKGFLGLLRFWAFRLLGLRVALVSYSFMDERSLWRDWQNPVPPKSLPMLHDKKTLSLPAETYIQGKNHIPENIELCRTQAGIFRLPASRFFISPSTELPASRATECRQRRKAMRCKCWSWPMKAHLWCDRTKYHWHLLARDGSPKSFFASEHPDNSYSFAKQFSYLQSWSWSNLQVSFHPWKLFQNSSFPSLQYCPK